MRVFIFLLLIPFISFAGTFYVTTSGSVSNGGTNDTTDSWTLATAFAQASAGDTVYVKAGNYGALYDLAFANSGTAANPIVFIGYKTTINDITATTSATFNYTDFLANSNLLDSTEMPYLQGTRTNSTSVAGSIAINVNKAYVEIHNFMFTYYDYGVYVSSNNVTVDNIVAAWMGNFNPNDSYNPYAPSGSTAPEPDLPAGGTTSLSANFTGQGGWFAGTTGCTLKNSAVFNGGARGFVIVGGLSNLFENIQIVSDQNVNPTDYYLLLYGTDYNTLRGIDIQRNGNLTHRGHGLGLKCGSSYNIMEDITIYNTAVEVNGGNTYNTFDNIVVQGANEPTWGGYKGGIKFDSGSNYNTVKNSKVLDAEGIIFLNSSEGDCNGNVAAPIVGNIFVNVVVANAIVDNAAPIAFHWNSQSFRLTGNVSGTKFYNCTFDGSPYLYRVDRQNSTTEFINCSFSNFTSGLRSSRFTTNTGLSIGATYTNCNFSSANFTTPTGTNIRTDATGYTDASADDYSLTAGSGLIGDGVTTIYNFDINGNTRDTSFDVGAYEYGSVPTSDVTPPVISGVATSNVTSSSFTVGWDIDEASTGTLRYGLTSSYTDSIVNTNFLSAHSITIQGLTESTTYHYSVRSVDPSGNDSVTSDATQATIASTVPVIGTINDYRAFFLKWFKFF